MFYPSPDVRAVDIRVPPEAIRAETFYECGLVLEEGSGGFVGELGDEQLLEVAADVEQELSWEWEGDFLGRLERNEVVEDEHLWAGVCDCGEEDVLGASQEVVGHGEGDREEGCRERVRSLTSEGTGRVRRAETL